MPALKYIISLVVSEKKRGGRKTPPPSTKLVKIRPVLIGLMVFVMQTIVILVCMYV